MTIPRPAIDRPTLGELLEGPGGRDNNFDAIRLLAALGVLVSHAYPISGITAQEPVLILLGGQSTFGTLCVGVFFFLSGLLVTQSYRSSGNLWQYLWKRVLRLYPALIVVVAAACLVLGPALTALPAHDYWRQLVDPSSLSTIVFKFANFLPGLFTDHPVRGSVNGSLWTIKYEIRCYLIVAVLGLLGLLRRNVIVLLLIGLLAWHESHWLSGGKPSNWAHLTACFASGMLASAMRDVLRPSARAAGLACLAIVAAAFTPIFLTVFALAVGFPVLYLSFMPWRILRGVTRHGDFSYGIYLYAFPMQQLAWWAAPQHGQWWVNVALSLPPTVLLAVASWYMVERPALRLKSRRVPLGWSADHVRRSA